MLSQLNEIKIKETCEIFYIDVSAHIFLNHKIYGVGKAFDENLVMPI